MAGSVETQLEGGQTEGVSLRGVICEAHVFITAVFPSCAIPHS